MMSADTFAHRHISPAELIEYVLEEHRLSDAQDAAIDLHLATCDSCAATTRQLRAIAVVWEHWTFATHAAAHRQARLDEVLHQVPGLEAPRLRWLRRWLETASGHAAAAARLLVDAAAQTAALVPEGLEAITLAANPWPVRLAAGPASHATRRAPRAAAASSVPQVAVEVGQAPPGSPRPILVRAGGLTPAQQQQQLLVVLLPAAGSNAPPLVRALHAPPSARHGAPAPEVFALFEAVPPGDYLVVIEPEDTGEPGAADSV